MRINVELTFRDMDYPENTETAVVSMEQGHLHTIEYVYDAYNSFYKATDYLFGDTEVFENKFDLNTYEGYISAGLKYFDENEIKDGLVEENYDTFVSIVDEWSIECFIKLVNALYPNIQMAKVDVYKSLEFVY